MNRWMTIRKGSTHLYIEYGHTHTSNLYGYNIQIRDEPDFEIWIDLSSNLRTRSKQNSRFIDAQELAEGEIERFRLLQIFYNKRIFQAISEALKDLPERPATWKLTLHLDRDWTFVIKPEYRGSGERGSLYLHRAT